MKYFVPIILLGFACVLFTGCSGNSLPFTPVTGHVTFSKGPPPKEGRISFDLISGTGIDGLPNRPGMAVFGPDGNFEAMTFQPGDGLLPGQYGVKIECVDGVPGPTTPWDTISFVPSDYQPPNLVVEQGKGAIEVSYDVPSNPKKR